MLMAVMRDAAQELHSHSKEVHEDYTQHCVRRGAGAQGCIVRPRLVHPPFVLPLTVGSPRNNSNHGS